MELTADRCEVECLHPEHVAPLLGNVVAGTEAENLAAIFELLADPTRARLLHALTLANELCVCDLALLLGRSDSALSHQLRLLRDRRVVSRRKAGRIVYYRLADEHIRHVLADGLRHGESGSDATGPERSG
jgi:ArsR family transcriptional regulator